jgi:predicted transcriptional regulator
MVDTVKIVELRNNKMSYIAIANQLGIACRTVATHLKKANLQNGERCTSNKLKIFSNLRKLKKDYLEGKLSLEKLSAKYEVKRATLTLVFRRHGIAIRDREIQKAYLRELGLYKKCNNKGENNPNFKHGKYSGILKKRIPEYHTQKYVNWKRAIFVRDNKQCKNCGSVEKINAHHIIPIRIDKSRFYDISNGITLCEECHKKTYFKENEFINKYVSLVNNTAKAGV